MKESLLTKFEEMQIKVAEDIAIDEVRLDDESLRTPKLHNRWLSELSEAAYSLKQYKNHQKKLFLERWKYWMGKQTDQYYAQYGIVHDKVIKADLDKYLEADDFLIEMTEIIEVQSQVVDFLEHTTKQIAFRGNAIRNAIDWRKFESGV